MHSFLFGGQQAPAQAKWNKKWNPCNRRALTLSSELEVAMTGSTSRKQRFGVLRPEEFQKDKQKLDTALTEGLEESFPASDATAVY